MRRLALASVAGFAFGSLMEFAYYKSGYCKFLYLILILILIFILFFNLDNKLNKTTVDIQEDLNNLAREFEE